MRHLPELTQESRFGASHLLLASARWSHKNFALGVAARGLYQSEPVGFGIVFEGDWQRLELPGLPRSVHRGSVRWVSLGAESDRFVQAMDEIYGTGLEPMIMRKAVAFSALSRSGAPRTGLPERLDLLLHLEARVDGHAEVELIVDVSRRRIELVDPSPDYAASLVSALKGAALNA